MFSWAGGSLNFKRNSVEISREYLELKYFLNCCSHVWPDWVSIIQTGQVTKCLADLWLGFGKLRLTQRHATIATCRPSGSGRDSNHDKLISYCQFIFIGALHHFHGGQGIIKPLNQVLTCRNLWSINWKQKSTHFPLYNREAAAKQGILIFSVLKLCPQIFSLFFIKLSLQFKFQLLDFVLKLLNISKLFFSLGISPLVEPPLSITPITMFCFPVLFQFSTSFPAMIFGQLLQFSSLLHPPFKF